MSEVTPRITQSYLEQFTNKTVRLVGKVTQLRGDTATLDAGGAITVALNRVCSFLSFFLGLCLSIREAGGIAEREDGRDG